MSIEQHPEGVLLLFALNEVYPEGGHLGTRVVVDLIIQNVDDGEIDADVYLGFSR